MKVLVFGKTGQVATELRRQADVISLDRSQADLTDPMACAALVSDTDADVVICAAAYTAVDAAESEEGLATIINGDSPSAIAHAAAAKSIPFLHVSTDYVFDGCGDLPRKTDEPLAPPNAYGRSKLAGENGVRNAGGNSAILRTSWVFSAHGNNFVKTMLRLSETRDRLNVVDDQIGGPTAAADIASALLTMAKAMVGGEKGGTYHFSGTPAVSWADFASEIFLQANLATEVSGIPTSEYPTPAARPSNSRLDCSALSRDFGIVPPNWKSSLSAVLQDLGYRDEANRIGEKD